MQHFLGCLFLSMLFFSIHNKQDRCIENVKYLSNIQTESHLTRKTLHILSSEHSQGQESD